MSDESGWSLASFDLDAEAYAETVAQVTYDTYSVLSDDPDDDRWVNLPERAREPWLCIGREALAAVLPDLTRAIMAGLGVEVVDIVEHEDGEADG